MFDEITPDEVAAWVEAGASVVDVREPWEYQSGHLPGAVNIPMGEVVERKGELTDPLVLVCRSGARSGRVAEYLVNNGHAKVANLEGGTERWMAEGKDVE